MLGFRKLPTSEWRAWDTDFGAKWHFMSTYRYFKLTRSTVDQIDIGAFFFRR